MGLREHLTPQRSNGFRSMVERIRSDARAALGDTHHDGCDGSPERAAHSWRRSGHACTVL